MAYELTGGALSTIMRGGHVESPIMQVLGVKKMSGTGPTARYRLLISDGVHVNTYAMLATQLNDKLNNGELEEYTIIRISRYISSVLPNSGKDEKRVMILLDINVVAPGAEVEQRIGNPQTLETSAPSTPAAVSASAAIAPSPGPAHDSFAFGPSQGAFFSNAPISEPNSSMATQPIPSLTPYSKKWAIKARVTNKSAIRTWSNLKQTGKLFSFDVLDNFGEIRITAFNEQCDKFYDLIEVGKVYIVSRGIVKVTNHQFCTLKNDYEVALYGDSTIIPVSGGSSEIPTASFNFEPLSSISGKDANVHIDVIGICRNVGELMTFMARSSQKELKKRELTLVDKSLSAVVLTLWGKEAEDFNADGQAVIAVKGATVNEYGDAKSLSASTSSAIFINLDIPEVRQMREWYDKEGSTLDYKNVSQRASPGEYARCIPLAEIDKLEADKQVAYYSCKATLVLIKSDQAIYYACPGENCKKKVMDLNNGMYRCEKCNRDYNQYIPRLLLSIVIADFSAHEWVTCFHEVAQEILGRSATELNDLNNKDAEAYQRVFADATFTSFFLRLRVHKHLYNDEPRLKLTVISAKPIDHVVYAKNLLEEIKELCGRVP